MISRFAPVALALVLLAAGCTQANFASIEPFGLCDMPADAAKCGFAAKCDAYMSTTAIKRGSRKVVSACFSSASPAMAPGIVAMMRNPTRRRSSALPCPRAAPTSAIHCARKYQSTAISVPTCSATSNARPGSSQ